ncbi:single-stranded-DNA-specific exonuclease RecJ [Conexibacter sp. DBS9H8]|uniref:single-stranded-DNA-specific exonuclease RecJ n=1 Tax=Conexibacter sp. DBS9H8 TaxID=2937801 RepID=UPI00200D252A|nr:single-stranded-DNA-specific exonuclease RecJ [Conexibacter sp. DBS9H8]
MAVLEHTAPAPSATEAPEGPEYEIVPVRPEQVIELERALGISHVLAQTLLRRGFAEPAEARAFLEPRERHSPDGFAGLGEVVARIEAHRARHSRIVVHGDYDVDGVCATAVLVRALRSLGANCHWYLPSRTEDGYGLAASTVDRLARLGTGLLITVDCGITAVEEVARAQAAGVEVIVTDHHQPRADGHLPDAPIVHPGVCGYPFGALCGTAVAHKVAEALGAPTVVEDIELVALATVADLVPLRGENRRIVREGLAAIANTTRPGLRALMDVSRTDPSGLDAGALGFRLAPRINAAGRLGRPDAALELLLTDDPSRAETIARELDRINLERRAVEQRITWEAEALALHQGTRPFYVLAGAGWHPGVVGIVASRIVERLHRPAVVIGLDAQDPSRPGHGSGRSIPGFDLLGALTAAAPELITYGGHAAAAGLTVAPDRIDALRDLLEAHAAIELTPDLLARRERVDAIVSGPDLTLETAEELARLEPCGIGNPAPRLLVPGARFVDIRGMSENRHARFSVLSGGARVAAVSFGCEGMLPAGGDGRPVNASVRLERNVWQGRVEARLTLSSAAPVTPAPIEVLDAVAPDAYLRVAVATIAAGPEPAVSADRGDTAGVRTGAGPSRTVIDGRGRGPLAVLAAALAAAAEPSAGSGATTAADPGGVLGVCACSERRVVGLAGRIGGCALIGYHGLAVDPSQADRFAHIVAIDPPATAAHAALLARGRGYLHLAWGEPEIRFSEQMHELEYGLRASLVTLYRALQAQGRVTGGELERLLRGDGTHPRPTRLAGRLLKVLTELELVSLDPELPAVTVADPQPTQLERSPAFRTYDAIYHEGQRFLRTTTASR